MSPYLFSSVDLMLDLLRNGTYSTGTLRSNRKGFPQDFKKYLKTGLPERGDYKTVQCGPVSITLWQDNKLANQVKYNITASFILHFPL